MGWLRCRLGFALTRSAVMCLRGSRSRAGQPRCVQQLAPNFRQRDCEAARGPQEGREMSKFHPRDPAVEKKTTSRCGRRCSTPGHELLGVAVALELANATPPSYDLFSSLFRVGLLSKVVEGQNGAPQDHM